MDVDPRPLRERFNSACAKVASSFSTRAVSIAGGGAVTGAFQAGEQVENGRPLHDDEQPGWDPINGSAPHGAIRRCSGPIRAMNSPPEPDAARRSLSIDKIGYASLTEIRALRALSATEQCGRQSRYRCRPDKTRPRSQSRAEGPQPGGGGGKQAPLRSLCRHARYGK